MRRFRAMTDMGQVVCDCGAILRSDRQSDSALGSLAANHMASSHEECLPAKSCRDCTCNRVFEPSMPPGAACTCRHLVGRHDIYCCVTECRETALPHSGSFIQFNDGTYAFFCRDHVSQFVRSAARPPDG